MNNDLSPSIHTFGVENQSYFGEKNQTITSQLIKCKSVESSVLDSCNLITLENGDLSKLRNLSPAKYFYSKFAKSKSRKNK